MYRHLSGQLSPRCEGLACRLYRAHYSRAASIPGINVPQPSSRASSTGQEVHRHIYVVHVRSRTELPSRSHVLRNTRIQTRKGTNTQDGPVKLWSPVANQGPETTPPGQSPRQPSVTDVSMHRSLLHNWLKGLVNPPIPVTYIELSTEHRYIMLQVNPELGTDKVHAIAHRPRCNLQDG